MIEFNKPMDYPEGSILHDVRYYKKSDRNPECFEVVYWSPISNQLEVAYEKAIVDIWFLKDEYKENYLSPQTHQPYQASQVPMSECTVVSCRPSQISKVIADNMKGDKWFDGYYDFYYKNHLTMDAGDMKKHMCECPWVFKGDFTPDVYYRLKWIEKFGENADISKVTCCLIDIETDVIDRTLDMKDYKNAPQPINAISLILPENKICALLVLGPRSIERGEIDKKFKDLIDKQQKAFNWLTDNIDEFKNRVVESDPDNKEYLDSYDIRVHIFDFNDEIKMIKTVFDYINKYRPWFVQSWNAIFDHNYLPNRISYLGYNPLDIIIPKEFQIRKWYYSVDKTKGTVKNNKDYLYSSTFSIYICQMKNFARIRKSQAEQRSLSLSYIGRKIAGIDKHDARKNVKFRDFAYIDFINFLLYNIRDTVVQLAIELITNDCKSLYGRSYSMATQYSKCFQETHIVRNRTEKLYERKLNLIQACRLKIDPNADHQFKGAYVAPVDKNAPTGFILNGKHMSNIIFGAMDADAKAYYPTEKMANNMDPMTLLYKCKINNQVFISRECINRSFNQEYVWYDSKTPPKPHDEDLSGPIINAYKRGNIMSLMNNFFNLPTIGEYFNYIDNLI